MNINHDAVEEILEEAAVRKILPYWQKIEPQQVRDKGQGELVTEADEACERFLSAALRKTLDGSLVLGEEAVAVEPSLLGALESDRPVWVIDPLDGTGNFAAHTGPFALMVCLVFRAEILGSWIYEPLEESLLSAELGGGTFLAGLRLTLGDPEAILTERGTRDTLASLRGALLTGFLPPALREHAEAARPGFARSRGSGCAGHDYRQFVTGQLDFLFYYRTLVWDHAPGVLAAREAGGFPARYDGSPYCPGGDEPGLICANGRRLWQMLRDTLLPAEELG